MAKNSENRWYADGLYFECTGCGGCCSGPAEGYIWVSRPEIKLIADFLKETTSQLRQRALKRVGLRTTVIEQAYTKDCVFLQRQAAGKICTIYPVRPAQCRSWPFWPDNLANPAAWDKAAQKCPGINHGRFYSSEQIGKIRKNKKWWQNPDTKS